MADVLYTDKLVIDLFVASSIISPYWVTALKCLMRVNYKKKSFRSVIFLDDLDE